LLTRWHSGSQPGPATILLGSNRTLASCLLTLPPQSSQLQETRLQNKVFALDRLNGLNRLSGFD